MSYQPSSTAFATTAPVELWVDAATGSDFNRGDADAPLASLVEAERRIPHIVAHPVTIHVALHTGAGYAPPTFRPRHMQASVDIIADSGGTNDDGFAELLAPQTAQAGTSHTQLVAPAGLGTNTYRGKTIDLLSGLAVGHRRTLKSHTDTTIVPCLLWPGSTIAPGDSFRIVEPVTAIDLDQAEGARWEATRGCSDVVLYGLHSDPREIAAINFVNFKLVSATVGGSVIAGPQVRFFGCEFEVPSLCGLFGGSFAAGIDRIDVTVNREVTEIAARFGYSDIAWVGWGLFASSILATTKLASGWFYGLVAPQVLVYGGHFDTRGCNIHTGGATVYSTADQGPADVHFNGKVYLPDIALAITNAAGPALSVYGAGAYVQCEEAALVASTVGVYAAQGASLSLGGASAAVSINGATGLKAELGGRIEFRNTSIIASGNEVEVGNTPTTGTLAGNFASAKAYLAEADGSVVQRVA